MTPDYAPNRRQIHTESTPPAPSAVDPKPNPLRIPSCCRCGDERADHPCGLCPDCMRVTAQPTNPLRGDAAPGTCRSCSAFAAVRISANCTYCASRLHGTVRHYEDGDGIVAAVQPAAVEEVRQPWDWDPADVEYLP